MSSNLSTAGLSVGCLGPKTMSRTLHYSFILKAQRWSGIPFPTGYYYVGLLMHQFYSSPS